MIACVLGTSLLAARRRFCEYTRETPFHPSVARRSWGPSCSVTQPCKKEARTRSFVSLGFPRFTLFEVPKTLLLLRAGVQDLGPLCLLNTRLPIGSSLEARSRAESGLICDENAANGKGDGGFFRAGAAALALAKEWPSFLEAARVGEAEPRSARSGGFAPLVPVVESSDTRHRDYLRGRRRCR